MKNMFAGRKFQFWQYSVSHGELLIRSPKDAAHPRNADIVFVGVEYVDLPRFLLDVEIREPADEDVARAEERLGKPVQRQSVVVLKSQGRHYLVVAGVAKAVETDMDIFDSPFK